MKVIALIHTVKPLLNNFEKILEDTIDEKLKIHNIYDDFLASDPDECGEFTINNANRLLSDIKSAELTGADLIIVTCSTLTPIVAKVRPFIKVPIIAIDDLMTKEAVKLGSK
ncbi:MAG: Asp/Glu racemase, partial [Lachnospirales bacterium]